MTLRSWLAGRCRVVAGVAGVLIALALPVSALGDEAGDARVDKAIAQLIAEADELDRLKEVEHPAVFTRPHRVVRALKPQDGEAVALRLADTFTGKLDGDTYVRWHLMPAVRDWLASRAVSSQEGSPKPLPGGVGRALRSLMDHLPPDTGSRYENLLDGKNR